ncbi:hypothetical protein NLG97_g5860 [Lecanicillium saksenae]|uniref:Uncharacterized protein n=1 Tax=Lecanicillium saksenae TaxID=468837 RepID=A0ACC1QSE7_9HYPO|nr:hypothetical protein NLG97_g5860 [Lecanicillium saksenae]
MPKPSYRQIPPKPVRTEFSCAQVFEISFTTCPARAGEADVADTILYEKGIGCVTAMGFNANDVSPDESIFGEIAELFGQDIANTTEPGYVDDSRALEIAESKDGFIYLAKTDQKYDFSSSWGSVKKGSNIVDLDVLRRIASYQFSTKSVVAAQIRMYKPSKVPRRWHARYTSSHATPDGVHVPEGESNVTNIPPNSGLVIVKNSKLRHYAVMLKSSEVSKLFYPTFCNTTAGFRLFATQEPFNNKGQVNVKNQKTSDQTVRGLKGLGVTNTGSCRTIQLAARLELTAPTPA